MDEFDTMFWGMVDSGFMPDDPINTMPDVPRNTVPKNKTLTHEEQLAELLAKKKQEIQNA